MKRKERDKKQKRYFKGNELKWRKAIKCKGKLITLSTLFKFNLKEKQHVSLNYSSYVMML
jgi:hypothetical protein